VRPGLTIADGTALASALAADFEAEGQRALSARGRFLVALPGGSVASLFPNLSRLAFDWSRTEFFWVDERAVPPSDLEANFAAAYSTWLEPARVPRERIHRMRADEVNLHQAAQAYANELRAVAGNPPRMDFVLLGVGPDGHVASLFPGHPASGNERDLVAVVEDAPKPPPRRLTLTLPVLANAERVVVVALGKSKAQAIYDALNCRDSVLPVGAVVARARRPLILIDREAASLVSAEGSKT
jgi:6-phosphogluconolactonase